MVMTVLAQAKVPTLGPPSLSIIHKSPIKTSFPLTKLKLFMALMVMTSSKVKVATTSSMAVQLEVVAPKMATTPSKVVMETIKLMVAPTMINSLVTLVMTPSMVAAEMTA